MRQKRLDLSLVIILLGLGFTGLQAQTMNLRETSGAQTAYTINHINKLSFSLGNIIINADGNSDTYTLTEIQSLNFIDLISTVQKSLSTRVAKEKQQNESNNSILFPNPVNEVLNIQYNSDENQLTILEIFSAEGKVLCKEALPQMEGIHQVNVSSLQTGIYFCKLTTEQTTHTIKFFKK